LRRQGAPYSPDGALGALTPLETHPTRSFEELRARRVARRRLVRRRRLGALAVLLALGGAGAGAAALWPGGSSPAGAAQSEPQPTTGPATTAATAPTPAETAAAPPPEPPPAPPALITIAAVGDIAMGDTASLPRGGARTLFALARPLLAGDVVLGNLETTLTTAAAQQCGPKSGNCFSFRAPPAYARGLAHAGFTVLNLANNHAFDFGREGLRDTIAALKDARVRQTGRPGQIAYLRIGKTRVAVIGFAPYDWAQDMLDLGEARRLVRRAAKRADVVVVTMHAGGEGTRYAHVRPGAESFLGEPRGDPVRFAHAVVQAGADLVVGHGPHVLRGMEWYRGRLVAYSLGNFASYRNFDVTGAGGVSAILYVTLRSDGVWVGGRLAPIRLTRTGKPARDPEDAAFGVVRSLSRQDCGRRAVRVFPDGDLRPPR